MSYYTNLFSLGLISIIIYSYLFNKKENFTQEQSDLADKVYEYLKNEGETGSYTQYLDFLASIKNKVISIQKPQFYFASKYNLTKEFVLQEIVKTSTSLS